jgi:hypothetical protein
MLMKTQAGFWYATASTMPCHALWAVEHASYRLRLDRGTGQVLSVGTAPLTRTHQGGSSIVRLWLPLLAGTGWQGGCLSHPLPAGGTPPLPGLPVLVYAYRQIGPKSQCCTLCVLYRYEIHVFLFTTVSSRQSACEIA